MLRKSGVLRGSFQSGVFGGEENGAPPAGRPVRHSSRKPGPEPGRPGPPSAPHQRLVNPSNPPLRHRPPMKKRRPRFQVRLPSTGVSPAGRSLWGDGRQPEFRRSSPEVNLSAVRPRSEYPKVCIAQHHASVSYTQRPSTMVATARIDLIASCGTVKMSSERITRSA